MQGRFNNFCVCQHSFMIYQGTYNQVERQADGFISECFFTHKWRNEFSSAVHFSDSFL